MLEKFFTLVERITVALETIARAPAVCAGHDGLAVNRTPKIEKPVEKPAELDKVVNPFETATGQAVLAQEEKSKTATPTPTPTVTREQVGTALIALATGKSREVAVGVLSGFNATVLKDVKEADYGKLFEAIQKASI